MDEHQPMTFSSGDLARLTGNSLRTIRYYEEIGLLDALGRTEGGHRMFAEPELEKLRFICDMRELGLPIKQIKEIIELRQSGRNPRELSQETAKFLQDQYAEAKRRLNFLRRIVQDFAAAIEVIEECQTCDYAETIETCSACEAINRDGTPQVVRVIYHAVNGHGPNGHSNGNGRTGHSLSGASGQAPGDPGADFSPAETSFAKAKPQA